MKKLMLLMVAILFLMAALSVTALAADNEVYETDDDVIVVNYNGDVYVVGDDTTSIAPRPEPAPRPSGDPIVAPEPVIEPEPDEPIFPVPAPRPEPEPEPAPAPRPSDDSDLEPIIEPEPDEPIFPVPAPRPEPEPEPAPRPSDDSDLEPIIEPVDEPINGPIPGLYPPGTTPRPADEPEVGTIIVRNDTKVMAMPEEIIQQLAEMRRNTYHAVGKNGVILICRREGDTYRVRIYGLKEEANLAVINLNNKRRIEVFTGFEAGPYIEFEFTASWMYPKDRCIKLALTEADDINHHICELTVR